MGANLSLLAPHAHTVAVRSYVDVLPDYRFLEVVNNTRFLKTIKAYHASSGTFVVIKIFIKPPQAPVRLHEASQLMAKEASLLAPSANLLVWRNIIETDSAGYLVRQMVRTNLYDRLSLRPFLAPIEKRWLVFQMLRTMDLLHGRLRVCHGDLKTENFLVSSSNWLVLTDFAAHTKPVYLPEDNPSEYVFYFDSSNRRACYVAPERFYSKAGHADIPENRASWRLSPAADLFSLGCVIAELYMDGEPPFTLSDLYRYKKGEQEPSVLGISDPDVQQMARNLLALDPAERRSARQILDAHRGSFFPTFFYDFLYDFMTDLNTAENYAADADNDTLGPSDLRIEKIYASFDTIVTALGIVYHEPRVRGPEEDDSFPYLKLSLKGMPREYSIGAASQSASVQSAQGALLLLDTVFSLVRTTRRTSNKVKACEIILALSEHVGDEAKLDRSLPFICSFLDEFIDKVSQEPEAVASDPSRFPNTPDFSSRVASVSILAMTNLLQSCSSVNPVNAHVFPDYIFPKLKSLAFLSSSMREDLDHVKSTLSACLPHLMKISDRFMGFASCTTQGADGPDGASHNVAAVSIRCENDIKDITEALLTDPNVNVRIRLISNILPMCQYFGVDKTNDIILPHLITYLNDPSFHLRLAFLSSIKSIGGFIGVLAFEQYLLPLLVQTLGDHEPFIVLKVLEIFNYFVSERIINPKAQFNALSIYKELLSNTTMLLLQPNEWIRQSVVCLILSISSNLLNADRFCFLYPLIKSFLTYDISVLSWNQLYPCLTKPLSKQVFEMALTWLTKSSGKSLFWKQTSVLFYKNQGKRKLVTYTKDMGKSIYAGASSASTTGQTNPIVDTSLSHTDRQWILKLKSVGMEETDLWKISTLRTYLTGINRSRAYTESGDHTNFRLATSVNIPPLNIFCELKFKSETLTNHSKGTVSGINPLTSVSERGIAEIMTGSISLTHGAKAKASLQTNESNVFAEMNPSHDAFKPKRDDQHHYESNKNNSQMTTNKVLCATDERIISVSMRHNFAGKNPYILSYLQNLDFRPSFDDFPEFGPLIKSNKVNNTQENMAFYVRGTPVTHFNTTTTAKSIEAITKLALCPSSEFFVSGSETGALKVWDTSKLETVSAKTAVLSLELGKEITDIVFIPHRFVFAVATADGQIRLFRVQVTRGKSHKILNYSKLALIRAFKLESGFARTVSFAQMNSTELLVVSTSTCQIVAFDIIKTTKVFDLQNPPQHGVPTTFIISKTSSWLLLGTSEGVLSLWDIRFEILLRAWKVVSDQVGEKTTEIRRLVLFPYSSKQNSKEDHEHFAMIGGINERDVTVWEIPSFECREVLSANQDIPTLKNYNLQKLDFAKESSLDSILANFTLDFDQAPNKCNTAVAFYSETGANSDANKVIATSTNDNRIILWNLTDISQSTLLLDSRNATFTKSQINLKLSISYEKLAPSTRDNILQKQNPIHDTITDLIMVTNPYPMIVAAERNGSIRVYK